MAAKAFDETSNGTTAHVEVLSVDRTEVVRTSSIDSPYRGVASGRISVTTEFNPALGLSPDYGTMNFTAGFDVRTDEASRVRGWVLSDVKAFRDNHAGGQMDVSSQARTILSKSADAAVDKIQEFLQRQPH